MYKENKQLLHRKNGKRENETYRALTRIKIMQCFKKNMKSERRAIKKYSYALCCQSYACFIIITPMTLWLTSPSVVQCVILSCNQSRLLVKRLGTKMFLKPEFFFSPQTKVQYSEKWVSRSHHLHVGLCGAARIQSTNRVDNSTSISNV